MDLPLCRLNYLPLLPREIVHARTTTPSSVLSRLAANYFWAVAAVDGVDYSPIPSSLPRNKSPGAHDIAQNIIQKHAFEQIQSIVTSTNVRQNITIKTITLSPSFWVLQLQSTVTPMSVIIAADLCISQSQDTILTNGFSMQPWIQMKWIKRVIETSPFKPTSRSSFGFNLRECSRSDGFEFALELTVCTLP